MDSICECICVSRHGHLNRCTDHHQTWLADTTYNKLKSDRTALWIWGRFEAKIKVQSRILYLLVAIYVWKEREEISRSPAGKPGKPNCGSTHSLMARCYH